MMMKSKNGSEAGGTNQQLQSMVRLWYIMPYVRQILAKDVHIQ